MISKYFGGAFWDWYAVIQVHMYHAIIFQECGILTDAFLTLKQTEQTQIWQLLLLQELPDQGLLCL